MLTDTTRDLTMKHSLRVFAIGALIVAFLVVGFVVYLIYWITTPGDYEGRFDRIKVGMSEKEVEDIMGSEGDITAKTKKYAITGHNRQRVWAVTEKGENLELVVVFDADSQVVTKQIYKSSVILNEILKDL
jgi:hypothetical protein